MSDDWIVLIPEEPGLVPKQELHAPALARFRELLPEAYEVRLNITEKIRFVDPGANWGRVDCPSCGAAVPQDWWFARLDEDYKDGFPMRTYPMPCCAHKCRLHDLAYEWPVGFARFSLEALSPNIGKLPETMRRAVEAILGMSLRTIYQHY